MKRRRARKDRREGARAQARPAADDARAGDARAGDARWLAALLLIAALVAYLPALGGGFVWDDDAHVTRPELRSLLGLWRIWTDVGATSSTTRCSTARSGSSIGSGATRASAITW